MTTGELLVARAAMKPLATLNRPTLGDRRHRHQGAETVSFKERTDVTAVPAMGVVAETMVALVLADEALRKFGGDSVRAGPQPESAQQVARAAGAAGRCRSASTAALNWDAIEAFADLDVPPPRPLAADGRTVRTWCSSA